jgi:hypothetical protein
VTIDCIISHQKIRDQSKYASGQNVSWSHPLDRRSACRRIGMQPVGARRSAGQSSGDGSRGWRVRAARTESARVCSCICKDRAEPACHISRTPAKASAAPSQELIAGCRCLAGWLAGGARRGAARGARSIFYSSLSAAACAGALSLSALRGMHAQLGATPTLHTIAGAAHVQTKPLVEPPVPERPPSAAFAPALPLLPLSGCWCSAAAAVRSVRASMRCCCTCPATD